MNSVGCDVKNKTRGAGWIVKCYCKIDKIVF